VKANTAATSNRREQGHFSSEPTDTKFEHILEWACLGAAHVRKSAVGIAKHRQALKAKGEIEERLREVADWRSSLAFTAREKAALSLSESISLHESKESSQYVIERASQYFDTSEMVRLAMTITAVNDWIKLHSDPAMRILVVEDNPLDQELLRIQLQKAEMGNNVTFVSDGLKALELLTDLDGKSFRQSLMAIFLDVHLPGMSGIELLRRIRALPDMMNLPVIVMTSSNDPRDMAECQRLGATFVPKPVTYSSFFNAVADTVNQIAA
jgi:two-component system response regulator